MAKQGTLFGFSVSSSKREVDEYAVRNKKRKISKNSYEEELREGKFLSEWKKDFPWVVFADDMGHMYCMVSTTVFCLLVFFHLPLITHSKSTGRVRPLLLFIMGFSRAEREKNLIKKKIDGKR